MSAKDKRSSLSLSRKRKRNVSSCSLRIEALDVGEDLDLASNAAVSCSTLAPDDESPLPSLIPALKGCAKHLNSATLLQTRTISCEKVDSEQTRHKAKSNGELLSMRNNDPEYVDEIDIYSQDWRVWVPQNALDNCILSKKQTSLRSFFSCTPAMKRKLHPDTVGTGKRTTMSQGKHEQQSKFSINKGLKSDGSCSSKSSYRFSPGEVFVQSHSISPDASELAIETKSSISSATGISMVAQSCNSRSGRSVSDQASMPSSSRWLRRSHSDSGASARRRVCPQYKWIPGYYSVCLYCMLLA